MLTSLLLALLCFHEYVWMMKKKKKRVYCFYYAAQGFLFPHCTGHMYHHKPVSPRASSSVSTSVMYLKSIHETICLGSWIDTHKTCYFPCDHILDINQTPTFPVTHHVNKQLPQWLQGNESRIWVCHEGKGNWVFLIIPHQFMKQPHLALCSRPQVPHSIQDCSSGQVDHSFLWA